MWKWLLRISVAVALLIAVGFGGLWWAARQEPDFYEQVRVVETEPEVRKQEAQETSRRFASVIQRVRQPAHQPVDSEGDPDEANADTEEAREVSEEWSEEFTERQINSWLAEEFPSKFRRFVPSELSDPRIDLADSAIRVGFRVNTPQFKGVVSLAVLPELLGPNQLRLTIQSLRAGLIPVDASQFREEISRKLDRARVRYQWSRHNDRLALVLRPTEDIAEIPVLESLEISDDRLQLRGKFDDAVDGQSISTAKAIDSVTR
ncbi:hypothetical protein [Stratiformator vulcanicus]|uniref:Uncharacterized protein n=1 Tax=Stratiformator vulcanicus TaxID=2527980 RepID=A0A517R6V8_9PLAN|nr:hypothetical protein [Stratiformator vulcanicus]QDT39595.1 hypothetical protein Pan189_40040 [Stratiformator vulcanicus]